jgi:oligosaccharide repeat unit polymerase
MHPLEKINFVLCLFLALFSGYLSVRRLKQRNVTSLLYGLYFVFFGVTNALRIVSGLEYSHDLARYVGGESSFPVIVELKANLINLIMIFFFFIVEEAFVRRKRGRSALLSERRMEFFSKFLWVILIISVLGFMAKLKVKGVPLDVDALIASEMRTVYRTVGIESSLVVVFINQAIGLIMIYNYLALLRGRRFHFSLGVLFTILLVVSSGTRSYVLFSLGPFLYYYITRKKFRSSHIAFGLIFLIAIAPISEIIRSWRWLGQRNLTSLLNVTSDVKTYSLLFTYPGSELNIYTYSLNNALVLFPEKHDWLYGHTYRNILLFWVPPNLLEKPKTIHLFKDLLFGERSAYLAKSSAHPTFTGDSYMNFGYLFWLPALFWGGVFSIMYIKSKRNSIIEMVMGSCSVYFLMYLFRGSIYLGCVTVIMVAAFLVGLEVLYEIVCVSKAKALQTLQFRVR